MPMLRRRKSICAGSANARGKMRRGVSWLHALTRDRQGTKSQTIDYSCERVCFDADRGAMRRAE